MGFKRSHLSHEEFAAPGKVKRRNQSPMDSGFADGTYGRGSTPYKSSHSSAKSGHPIEKHTALSGRGGTGVIGKGDGHKTHSEDVAHPRSHAEFEALGAVDDKGF